MLKKKKESRHVLYNLSSFLYCNVVCTEVVIVHSGHSKSRFFIAETFVLAIKKIGVLIMCSKGQPSLS